MSRRKAVAKPRATPSRGPRAARRGPGAGRIAALAVVVLATGTGAWFALRRDVPPPAARLPSLTPREAMDRAIALHRGSRFTEALPLYRIARTEAERMPDVHRLYAAALYASTFELRPDGTPLARSSFERIAAMRIADGEIHRYERFPLRGDERWEALDTRGLWNAYWGFPWDALQQFRRAAEAVPEYATARATVAAMEDRLRRPHLSTLQLSGDQP